MLEQQCKEKGEEITTLGNQVKTSSLEAQKKFENIKTQYEEEKQDTSIQVSI